MIDPREMTTGEAEAYRAGSAAMRDLIAALLEQGGMRETAAAIRLEPALEPRR